jgi:hypothetical protein
MILAVRSPASRGVRKIGMIRNRHYIPRRLYLHFFVPKSERGRSAGCARAKETV